MAKYDNHLLFSVFVLFSGFMLFIFNLINRLHTTIDFMHKFYVIFLFLSIVISIIGIFLVFSWHLKSSNPFLEGDSNKITRTQFPSYLASGIIMLMIGLYVMYSIDNESIFIKNFSLLTSIVGIFMLTNGLRFFWFEVLFHNIKLNKKKSAHT